MKIKPLFRYAPALPAWNNPCAASHLTYAALTSVSPRFIKRLGGPTMISTKLFVRALLSCACVSLPMAAKAVPVTTLYAFANVADGYYPRTSLIHETTGGGGLLLGTTQQGGASQSGTVFSYNLTTNIKSTVHSFGFAEADPLGGLVGFSLAGVPYVYGTTAMGGTSGRGTIYRIDLATLSTETTRYSFPAGSHGRFPIDTLIKVGGVLYGVTENGGSADDGTIFKFKPANDTVSQLNAFAGGADARFPYGGLININGMLYGTTHEGSTADEGTLYKFDPSTNIRTTLFSFGAGSNGVNPAATLISNATAAGTVLYGTTSAGGSGFGTVFSYGVGSGVVTTLHAFASGTDGANPYSGLTRLGKYLYGTTTGGGSTGMGTVFSIKIATGAYTVIHTFTGGSEGRNPYGDLLAIGETLYGTTRQGGPADFGTLFSITP